MLGGGSASPCSKSGCDADAARAIHWRNPRIHTPDRVKTWATCDAHGDELAEWLRSRGFPVVVTGFGATVDRVV